MASLNRVLLIGNLTRDPELRYIPSGSAVATFTLAVNRNYKLPSGERKEEVSFIRSVVWGRMAETCCEYLKKGSSVFVEGRLQSRSWEAQDGQKRSTTEVIASTVQFLNTRGGQKPGAPSQDEYAGAPARGSGAKEPLEEISLDLPPEPLQPDQGEEAPF
ncbi:MAG: single-stranded DNA-binding protein [Candidatus Omnitrophica bacterium]|nr:single-stranded DNA-binding protein [Candidatus Omnitrophota bacterium]